MDRLLFARPEMLSAKTLMGQALRGLSQGGWPYFFKLCAYLVQAPVL